MGADQDVADLEAVVALPEQDGLRLTTNIVGCEPDEVTIGMDVEVEFLEYDGVWLPLFRPAGAVEVTS